jgi:hypothetical protein
VARLAPLQSAHTSGPELGRRATIPVVLLRSHTKLDALSVEYGRLGSAIFPNCRGLSERQKTLVKKLSAETNTPSDCSAARPSRRIFPLRRESDLPLVDEQADRRPFEERQTHEAPFLSNIVRLRRRISFLAWAIFNIGFRTVGRRESRARGRRGNVCRPQRERFAHAPRGKLRVRLRSAAEWAQDRTRDRYVVGLAAADLPTPIWDDIVAVVAAWRNARESRSRCCHRGGATTRR